MKVSVTETTAIKLEGTEKDLSCNACKKYLGTIFLTNKKNLTKDGSIKLARVKYVCPCGDISFLFKFDCHSYFVPADNLEYENFSYDCGTNILRLKEKK